MCSQHSGSSTTAALRLSTVAHCYTFCNAMPVPLVSLCEARRGPRRICIVAHSQVLQRPLMHSNYCVIFPQRAALSKSAALRTSEVAEACHHCCIARAPRRLHAACHLRFRNRSSTRPCPSCPQLSHAPRACAAHQPRPLQHQEQQAQCLHHDHHQVQTAKALQGSAAAALVALALQVAPTAAEAATRLPPIDKGGETVLDRDAHVHRVKELQSLVHGRQRFCKYRVAESYVLTC